MKSTGLRLARNQAVIGIALFLASILLAWGAGQKILAGDFRALEFAGMVVLGCGIAIAILQNWRVGFYLFFIWMLVEDLARKYTGNGTTLFFGKDVLLAFVYVALYLEIRRGRAKWIRAPFLLFLSLFFWLAVLEVFNPYSPSILYGLLGLKLYFYYVPLIYVGYALIRTEEDLAKFLRINAFAAIVISAVGIVQAIRGNSFLNPSQLAPALQDLGNLQKVTPISGEVFNLPDSVFVSAGRFDMYLFVAFVLVLGATGYMLIHTRRRWIAGLLSIASIGSATLLCGNRGAVLLVCASALVLSAGFIWGASWRWSQAHRLRKAVRNSLIVGALALAAVIMIFPKKAGSRMDFYRETLTPESSAYQLSFRTWDYPLVNFLDAFKEHWVVGSGTGTASLGTQYVSNLLGQPPPNNWVEDGFGDLIVEMGILAPILWLLWSGALVLGCWKVVRRLRSTRFFPLALVIAWYVFLVSLPLTYGALSVYQDYICCIYMWLMIGILYRLPEFSGKPLGPTLARSITLDRHSLVHETADVR